MAGGVVTKSRSQSAPNRYSTPSRRRSQSPTQQRGRHESPPRARRESREGLCSTPNYDDGEAGRGRGGRLTTPDSAALGHRSLASTPDAHTPATAPAGSHSKRSRDSTKEVLEFVWDNTKPLLDELQRLCVLQRPSRREERLNREGKWCAVTCQKLDVGGVLCGIVLSCLFHPVL